MGNRFGILGANVLIGTQRHFFLWLIGVGKGAQDSPKIASHFVPNVRLVGHHNEGEIEGPPPPLDAHPIPTLYNAFDNPTSLGTIRSLQMSTPTSFSNFSKGKHFLDSPVPEPTVWHYTGTDTTP